MEIPYVNTYLTTKISLFANQMDNDIYKHLKENLIKKLQGKCYKSYGYISKIYKIDQILGNNIIPEDPSASVIYNVKFSCKLCKPLKNTTIIAEINKINKNIIFLTDGPIHIMIFEGNGHVNENNFVYDDKIGYWLAKLGDTLDVSGLDIGQSPISKRDKGMKVTSGSYVKIKVIETRAENNSTRILVVGIMDSLASDKEVKELIKLKEKDDLKFQDYNIYSNPKEEVEHEELEESEEESEESEESDSKSKSKTSESDESET